MDKNDHISSANRSTEPDVDVVVLAELDLALIGGGCGEVVWS